MERRRKSIQFDSKQRLWIEEQCLFQFKKLNVDEPSKMDVLTVETLESMNIEIPEELYSKMLLVPLWMWNGNDAAKYPDYVQNMMPQSVMKELVLYNIRNNPLRDSIAAAHIRYCEQNSISGIKDFVVEYLLREDSRYYWHVALNYLNKLYGIGVIVHEVLPECKENELLQSIANLVPFGFESSMLDAKLYEAYRQTGDSYCQGMLIRRNNRSALEHYYREAEEKNQIPDYPRSNNVPTLTETIRNSFRFDCLK